MDDRYTLRVSVQEESLLWLSSLINGYKYLLVSCCVRLPTTIDISRGRWCRCFESLGRLEEAVVRRCLQQTQPSTDTSQGDGDRTKSRSLASAGSVPNMEGPASAIPRYGHRRVRVSTLG